MTGHNGCNRYDYLTVFLLAMLCFGGVGLLGGGLTPLRILPIPVFAYFVLSGGLRIRKGILLDLHLFLAVFGLWAFASLPFAIDLGQAVRDVAYFVIHAALLLSIVYSAGKAVRPMASVCFGWTLAVALTMPIAMAEIFVDWHLPISIQESGSTVNYGGGQIAQKVFASATFGNWNAYVTFLCLSLPFLVGYAWSAGSFWSRLFAYALVAAVGCVVLINASRGGVVAYLLILMLAGYAAFRARAGGQRFKPFVMLFFAALLFWLAYSLLGFQFQARLGNTSLVSDDSRMGLIYDSAEILAASNYLGVGAGGMTDAYSRVSADAVVPHNLFLELLVQYGVILFVLFLYVLIRILLIGKRSSSPGVRFIVIASLTSLPVIGIINSGYWLNPYTWCYLGSVISVACYGTTYAPFGGAVWAKSRLIPARRYAT